MIRRGLKKPRTEENPLLLTMIIFSRTCGFSAASEDIFPLRSLTALHYSGQFSKHFSYENKMYFWSINVNLERSGSKNQPDNASRVYEFRQQGSSQRQMQTMPSSWSGLGNYAGSSTWHPKCCVSLNQDTGQQAASWGQTRLAMSWFETITCCWGPVPCADPVKTGFSIKLNWRGLKGDAWSFESSIPLLAWLDLKLVKTRQPAGCLLFTCVC